VKARRILSALLTIGVVATGCGSSKAQPVVTTAAPVDTTAAKPATTVAAAVTTPTVVDPSLPPLKIGFLEILSGAQAQSNIKNAIELAIAEVNAKGGAFGHKIEYTGYDTGDTTAPGAVTAVKKAISDKVNIMMGIGYSGQMAAIAGDVDTSGIPLLFQAQSSTLNKSILKKDIGARTGPTADVFAEAYVKSALDAVPLPTHIGIEHTSDPNSALVGKVVQQLLKDAKFAGKVTERSIPFDAKDTTEAVLAFKDVDYSIMNNVPSVGQIFMKQKAQNGLKFPGVMDTAGPQYVGANKNTIDEMAGMAYVSGCSTDYLGTKESDAFKAAYKAKFPSEINSDGAAPYYYADIYYIVALANAAKSIEAKDLKAAIQKVDFAGPCGQWKVDVDNNLSHDVAVVDLVGGKLKKVYTKLSGSPGIVASEAAAAAAAAATTTTAKP
jgi:ABC-type branched-subunit amino acid transport system substrate-binding protein